MALTSLEELLIDALKFFGLKAHLVSAIMVFLRTEQQQWQLVDFLQPYLDSDVTPSKQEIVDVVEQIVRTGNTKTYYSNRAELFNSASLHEFEKLKNYVLSGGNLNILNEEGHSLLTAFIRSYDPEWTDKEENEFDNHPNEEDEFWYTFVPQYCFIPLDHRESSIKEDLDFFFEYGADPNLYALIDEEAETALLWAIVNEDYYLTKYLLEHGAIPGINLYREPPVLSPDGQDYCLMDYIDCRYSLGAKGLHAQNLLAIAQLLWDYGLKNWSGNSLTIDPHNGVLGGRAAQLLFN